jgi:hypothetical protein
MARPPTSPKYTAVEGQVATVFKGDTLRSMLLEAYGFWRMGQIALIASIVSYMGAGLFLLLSLFGFAHLRVTSPESQVLPRISTRIHAATTA